MYDPIESARLLCWPSFFFCVRYSWERVLNYCDFITDESVMSTAERGSSTIYFPSGDEDAERETRFNRLSESNESLDIF